MMRKPPYAATVLGTFVVLTLLGVLAVGYLQGASLLTKLRESIKVVVELRPSHTKAQARVLVGHLGAQAYTRQGSVKLVTKEEGAKLLREEFGDDFLRFELENPLYDLITINLSEQAVTNSMLPSIRNELLARDEVLDVYAQEDLVASLTQRLDRIVLFLIIGGLLLLVGVVALMLNTTRLALLSQASLIKNMELVGASWSFIARPFLFRAVWQGALAGLLATAAVVAISAFAKTSLVDTWHALPSTHFFAIGCALLLIGVMLNFGSTFAVVRRTLRMRVNDLAVRG